ncbi:hypothetical protein HY734_03405 [Candidatus Uhrbacteria bacterium]|nr:hypothetical protein [Candidatus Uhrbacteria bacterium]
MHKKDVLRWLAILIAILISIILSIRSQPFQERVVLAKELYEKCETHLSLDAINKKLCSFSVVLDAIFNPENNVKLREIIARCASDWLDKSMETRDCYGVITIERTPERRFYDTTYRIHVNKKHVYNTIIGINQVERFLVVGDFLYVINQSLSFVDDAQEGYHSYLINDDIGFIYYSDEQVSDYLVINTKTGDIRTYLAPDDVPESERAFFEQIATHKPRFDCEKYFGDICNLWL